MLIIPGSATYLVQSGDTCQSIAAIYNNFTLSQFYYWNPFVPSPLPFQPHLTSSSDVGQTCFGLRAYVPVCIDTPWYTFVPPVQAADGTIEPASAVPVPVMPSITANCTKFELAGGGYRVDTIVAANGITMDDFLSWNSYIDKTNPVAWEGYWVCVSVS